jgi:hypothetical protein
MSQADSAYAGGTQALGSGSASYADLAGATVAADDYETYRPTVPLYEADGVPPRDTADAALFRSIMGGGDGQGEEPPAQRGAYTEGQHSAGAAEATSVVSAPLSLLSRDELKVVTLRNKDFEKAAAQPGLANKVKGLFVRVKLVEARDEDEQYMLDRIHDTLETNEPYSVAIGSVRRIKFVMTLETTRKIVRTSSVSNHPPTVEEFLAYLRRISEDQRSALHAGRQSLINQANGIRNYVPTAPEELKQIVENNTTLGGGKGNMAARIATLQRAHTFMSQSSAAAGTPTPTRPSPYSPVAHQPLSSQPTDATMEEAEKDFADYVQATEQHFESYALMRELTIRNREKNDITTVRAIQNYKQYASRSKFSDSGQLWEVDDDKRRLLCQQYDDVKEGRVTADTLLGFVEAPDKGPAAAEVAGHALEKTVAEALAEHTRRAVDMSFVRDPSLLTRVVTNSDLGDKQPQSRAAAEFLKRSRSGTRLSQLATQEDGL